MTPPSAPPIESRSVRTLAPRDYRVMPWKNGGGTTTEIYIHPANAGWDDFDWRVGIADIAQSGPFSSFPGIDRSIMLLDCPEHSGMRLTVDGRSVDLPVREFVKFAGEATTTGTLLGAPVRDFNVMSRRATVQHSCAFATLRNGAQLTLDRGRAKFVYIVSGTLTRVGDRDSPPIGAGMSLLSFDEPLTLRAAGGTARLIRAWFDSND